MLWMYQRVMFNKLDNPLNQGLMDLTRREMACFVPIIVLCFWIGLYPKPFIEPMMPSIMKVVEAVSPEYTADSTARVDARLVKARELAKQEKRTRLEHGHGQGTDDAGGHSHGPGADHSH